MIRNKKPWYSTDPNVLFKDIDKYMAMITRDNDLQPIKAIITPHAGYQFCGKIQASVFSYVDRDKYKIKNIILLAPCQTLNTIVHIPSYDKYVTPLGVMNINKKHLKLLVSMDKDFFVYNDDILSDQHTLDNLIPWLQYTGIECEIVPLVVGILSFEDIQKLANYILSIIDDNTILIVSSDFTHYGKKYDFVPITDNIKEYMEDNDNKSAKYIQTLDVLRFYEHGRTNTICGVIPITVLLCIANILKFEIYVIDYDTSGTILGSYENTVSYISFVCVGT